ncbi:sulfurtransferase TusA family protein [Thalassotalea maritima]|uniref:sulfurtransferase TusA family protein n=1 Tax=Thalassotalea maritima TaxID=3242416 RepID=UPI003528AF05
MIAQTYDGRADKCPLPLIKTKLLIKQLLHGQQAHIHLADSGSKSDIPAWLSRQNLNYVVHANHDQSITITITKE